MSKPNETHGGPTITVPHSSAAHTGPNGLKAFFTGAAIAGAVGFSALSLSQAPYGTAPSGPPLKADTQVGDQNSTINANSAQEVGIAEVKPAPKTKSNDASGQTAAAVSKAQDSSTFSLVKTAYGKSPPTNLIKQGQSLFEENCQVCHQADAIGKPGVAPSLINDELLSISSDKFLLGTIRDGREDTGMPPFAHLGRSKAKAIVAFLRSHQTLPDRSAQVDAEPDAHGDPRLGRQWYDNICSTCHGIGGNGYEAGGTGTAIGLPGFLNKVTDGFLRETIKSGRSNTRMLGFQGPTAMANLTNQEIDDIIVYLRTLAK